MVKILSQAGTSLADIYNVEGSVAGIDQLETRELPIVHEMGGTVFSERITGAIRRVQTGAINQSSSFTATLTDLPQGVFRVLGVVVLADTVARTSRAQVSLSNLLNSRDMPIFVYDTTNNVESPIEIEVDGSVVSESYLVPNPLLLPNLAIGNGQRQTVGEEIHLRGATTAFGAGTVTYTLMVYLALSHVGGIDNRGLPFPSW